MFDKLRVAFSNTAKSFSEKELKEKDIDDILFQLEISLLESDVATEVIDSIKSDLKQKLIGSKVNKNEIENFVKNSLIQNISSLFEASGSTVYFFIAFFAPACSTHARPLLRDRALRPDCLLHKEANDCACETAALLAARE